MGSGANNLLIPGQFLPREAEHILPLITRENAGTVVEAVMFIGLLHINLDGVVNSSDIVAIYNAIAGEGPTEGADVNGDGTINSADAVATYNIISGVE